MLTATENPCYQYAATINDDAGQNVGKLSIEIPGITVCSMHFYIRGSEVVVSLFYRKISQVEAPAQL